MPATARQRVILDRIETLINSGEPPPNTVELAAHSGYSTGEVARILDCLEKTGYILRIRGTRRNIRLTLPSVSMASDQILIDALEARGYMVRKHNV